MMLRRVSAFRLHEVLISFVQGFGDVSRSVTMLSALFFIQVSQGFKKS